MYPAGFPCQREEWFGGSGGVVYFRLLVQRENMRAGQRSNLARRTRAALRRHLENLLPPKTRVWIFGSLAKEGRFHPRSDIDLALDSEPDGRSIHGLTGELMDRMGRPVDIVLLPQCRFAEKIQREGEPWIL